MADERNRRQKAEGGKQIMAVSGLSHGTYKGMTIFETPKGFAVALGVLVYVSKSLSSLTGLIDQWFENKKN